MAIIQLTKGYTALIDDEFERDVEKFKWAACVRGDNIYARRTAATGKKHSFYTQYLHSFIYELATGEKSAGQWISFLNKNGLDCRYENLYCRPKKSSAPKIDEFWPTLNLGYYWQERY